MSVYRPNPFDFKLVEQMRELVRRARELLHGLPPPDTFAGRKTQEPFPAENDPLDLASPWVASKELQPPK